MEELVGAKRTIEKMQESAWWTELERDWEFVVKVSNRSSTS